MSSRSFRKLARCALAVGLWALALAGSTLRADDRELIEELRRRVEALERQNQELLRGPQLGRPPAEADRPASESADTSRKEEKKQPDEQKKQPGDWFEVGKQLELKARWDNGIWWLESADRAFRFSVGGRGQFDIVGMTGDRAVQFGRGGIGRLDDGVNFRRARLDVLGTLWETFDFYAQYDFLNTFNSEPEAPPTPATVVNTPVPTDLWVTITHLPWIGNLRIGNQKPPISFEHMTSSRFLNFLERSLAFDAFVEMQDNGFRPGIQAYNWFGDERASWAIGVFKPNRNIFGWNVGDGEWEVTGRLTALPIYRHDGRCLVHVGLGASHYSPDDGVARLRARTLLRNGPATLHPIVAETRPFASSVDLLVPEFFVVWGPFQFGAEYYANWVHDATIVPEDGGPRQNRGTVFYHGFYVEVLYFLTGEHRVYNRRARDIRRIASFDRVTPDENFFFVRREDHSLGLGRGAWQLAARYSYIDLEDKGVGIGIVHDVTLGVNWFWNANMKLQWNYIIEHRSVDPPNNADGVIQGVGMRLAWDF
ncbi:MAG TPA: porin [Gemmataceae bacterium]|nr:porin [Gemmataceae bacterium]